MAGRRSKCAVPATGVVHNLVRLTGVGTYGQKGYYQRVTVVAPFADQFEAYRECDKLNAALIQQGVTMDKQQYGVRTV